MGIYPQLEDNTSFFIAVDFDGHDWTESFVKLNLVCTSHKIPSYIARSRSANALAFTMELPSYIISPRETTVVCMIFEISLVKRVGVEIAGG